MNDYEIKKAIEETLTILENNFRYNYGKKISYDDIFQMMEDLYTLILNYEKKTKECGEICIKRYIPILDLLIKIDTNEEHQVEYGKHLHYAYKLAARISFEHYMIYREWDLPEDQKFFAPRYNAIRGYIHFLQEIVLNPKFTLLIFNAMAGFGKTYPEKIAEAWSYGIDDSGAILALCSNITTVEAGSNLVKQELMSDWFGEVFPKMKYSKDDPDYFLKNTTDDWKLKGCKLGASYNAATTNSNVIGQRASKWIHIDDLYKNYKEAMNQNQNKLYFNDNQLSWRTRFVLNAIPKEVITGTLWASGDFIDREIKQAHKEHTFVKHPKYKYTLISEDKSCVIIQIPAIDPYTEESVCPDLKGASTEELLKIKGRIDTYLWETNYQQKPTDPEELTFSYDKLRTYTSIPDTEYKGAYAVIDATRKSGKDFFSMPILKKVPNVNFMDYFLSDCLFTRTATKDMYEEIADKIIENKIITLVIESNVTSELAKNVREILQKRGYTNCEIIEKYNTITKSVRIENEKGIIKRQIVFPQREMYGVNTAMGKFMENLTTYNESGTNANDDAPDSLALFGSEIVEENSKPQVAEPLSFVRAYM